MTLSLAPAAAEDVPADGVPLHSIARLLQSTGQQTLRRALAEHGVTYGFVLTSEILANVSGGLRRGSVFEGKLEGYVAIDLEKAVGLDGFRIYANAFQIHGTGGISRDLVGNFNTISNIEALPTTRLSEAWIEKSFLGDVVNLRIGQLAADVEFFVSDYSTFFMNSDWPAITKQNLPSGGPAYPLSTPGIRLKIQPHDQIAVLVALYNGDPAGPGAGDPEERNRYGVNFRLQDAPLLLAELQYRYNHGKADTGLAGMFRFGGWNHFGRQDSQRFDTLGLSLANPQSSGIAARLRGDSGIYAVVDHQLYRPAGAAPDKGVLAFSRISASPSDRSFINYYLDGGVVFSGMVPGREEDMFGATFLYSNVSSAASALDRDTIFYGGVPQPIRNYEMTLTFAYAAQIVTGWTIQPEIQYVVHPGGRVPDPNGPPGAMLKNATVLGVRSTLRF